MPFIQKDLPQYHYADDDGLIGLRGVMHYFQNINTWHFHSVILRCFRTPTTAASGGNSPRKKWKSASCPSAKKGKRYILHADCREDAERIRNGVLAEYPQIGEVTISSLGVVIGAHCGPGLLTVFYLCESRQPE